MESADASYAGKDETVASGLALFDLNWPNIAAARDWVTGHPQDRETSPVFARFPRTGAHLLGVRRQPREQIRWLEAGVSAARYEKDITLEVAHLVCLG